MRDNTIITLENPAQDALTTFLRQSAQNVLQAAIEQEAQELILKSPIHKI